MPEYLSPGVYVEETAYRAKPIEGVATSTAGLVGQCRYGPVRGEPRLITSFDDFRQSHGGLDDLHFAPPAGRQVNYLAHGVKAFFDNGGQRVYVARVFVGAATDPTAAPFAQLDNSSGQLTLGVFRARFPGRAGNLPVAVTARRGDNARVVRDGVPELVGLRHGDLVEANLADVVSSEVVRTTGATGDAYSRTRLHWVQVDQTGVTTLHRVDEATIVPLAGFAVVQKLTIRVEIGTSPRVDTYDGLSTHPESPRYIGRVLRTEVAAASVEPPRDRAARVWFDAVAGLTPADSITLFGELLDRAADTNLSFDLGGGLDGGEAGGPDFRGSGTGHDATGLSALADVADIAIVAAPGGAGLTVESSRRAVRDALITHCEVLKYRFAILSAAHGLTPDEIREVRSQIDSTRAALYYPWVVVPNPPPAGRTLDLPPDGFVAGIYARSDVERGVHKAPANEVVRGALRFGRHLDKRTQDLLNPEGVNCLRSFEGRGHRVWGARTVSSDPEWKYVNVRRLFIFLEHSIDRSTQWAVFETNNEALWLKVRVTIESFLTDVWKTGALMGTAPDEAFFVRCDRTTMTQGDLDNGRLVCLIGVAPTMPAEFVIFRIGQWTADASIET